MKNIFKLNLQLFAGEGTAGTAGSSGAGGDGAGTTGDNGASAPATADAEQRLLELGVPKDKIRKRASKVASAMASQTAPTAEEAPTEATNVESATTETKPTTEDTPKRMTWEEIMADPEYNKQMQATMRARLKSEKSAEEALGKMAPAIEVMARKYGLDVNNMDYDALAKKINDDDSYYEDKALEMGVSVETAKKVDQMERNSEREKKYF